jgi:hypothetical protein
VQTFDGLQPISSIEEGDLVWAIDADTGEEGWSPVERTFERTARVLSLALEDDWSSEALTVTGEHPFFARERGWTPARDLLPGDEVYTSRGGWARIGGGTWIDAEQLVYNLEVEGAHTYFVGETGAWVHNACARAEAAANLHRLGLRGLNLRGLSFNSGRKALADRGFAYGGRTATGRAEFMNPMTNARVYYDSGGALLPGQSPHWHIRDGAGDLVNSAYTASGRLVPRSSHAGHIPGR